MIISYSTVLDFKYPKPKSFFGILIPFYLHFLKTAETFSLIVQLLVDFTLSPLDYNFLEDKSQG